MEKILLAVLPSVWRQSWYHPQAFPVASARNKSEQLADSSKAGGLLPPFQVAAAVWQRSIDTAP